MLIRLCVYGCRDRERDYDFLSSIEVVLVEQTDVMLMQNFDHLTALFKMMNCLPAQNRDTDFSRVRDIYLNQWYASV